MRQFYTIHGKNINKIKQKGKNLNTSNTQSLIQYVRNNTFPSGVAILSHVTRTFLLYFTTPKTTYYYKIINVQNKLNNTLNNLNLQKEALK